MTRIYCVTFPPNRRKPGAAQLMVPPDGQQGALGWSDMDDRQPGMYYVPYEGMRYWDGEKWTDQDPSADSPTLPPTEGSQVGTQSATEAARIRTGRSGRVVMLCIAMLAAGAAAVALASGSVSTSGLASALGFPGEAEAAAAPAVAAQAKVATPTLITAAVRIPANITGIAKGSSTRDKTCCLLMPIA